MAKVIKYSKDMLLTYLNLFKDKIYIYFYDLNPLFFDEVISKISNLTIEAKVIKKKNKNKDCLILLCEVKNSKINTLIEILDELDVGEFEIFEYDSTFDTGMSYFDCNKNCKIKCLYINKDEAVIQLYNV